jgi:signal transduction histidine kinase
MKNLPNAESTGERVKLLLVDDKKENLFALESLLKSPEIEFHRATSGLQALDLLLRHEFALSLIDVQMPEMDGFELAELMRGTEHTRGVPIIFVTAGAQSRQSTFRGYEKGAVDFLYKPLDTHVVRSKVQVFIDLARQRSLLKLQLLETQRALRERDAALTEATEALRTRDDFVSIASHELKTPLTSLYLQLQMLVRGLRKNLAPPAAGVEPPTPDTILRGLMKGLELCQGQSGKLAKLLDELLDLTRIRLGKLQLSKSTLDLAVIARDVVHRFVTDAGTAERLISVVTPAEPLTGQWDSTRIEQVITNLVSNAVKYGEKKPVSIELSREGAAARLVIRDQGIGIPEDLQEKIFERFERAVKGGGISGLGLGLYITRQIIEAHGGTISVKSRPGQGSVFTIMLPFMHTPSISVEP